MKKKTVRKLLLHSVVALSLFSFVFVNGHARFCLKQAIPGTEILKEEIAKDEEENQEFKLPDMSILEKIVEIVQNFVPGAR